MFVDSSSMRVDDDDYDDVDQRCFAAYTAGSFTWARDPREHARLCVCMLRLNKRALAHLVHLFGARARVLFAVVEHRARA